MLPIAVVVALKVFEVAAAATVTDAGTVRRALLSDSVTTTPPAGAGAVRVTVQRLEALGPRVVGLQASAEISAEGATVMIPPVADKGMAPPAAAAPKVLMTPIEIEPALGASATVTTATLPFGIRLALRPAATQVYEFAPATQLMLLPEDVREEAGVTEKPVTLAEG